MKKSAAILAVVTLCALAATPAAVPKSADTISVCAHYGGHTYEACFAYLINDSGLALRNYYANGRSADASQAGDALEDFHYRFRGQARNLIASRVANWPTGRNIVQPPRITIVAATSSLVSNTAQIITRETWRVTTSSGKVLYAETNRKHVVDLARVQGRFLHIWVVTAIH